MNEFWNFLKIVIVCSTALVIVFLILLSIPKSGLRQMVLKVIAAVAFIVTGLLVIYIISPVDAIPDLVPAAGQIDDIASAVAALATAATGVISYLKSRKNANPNPRIKKTA